jgi:CBS domain-containing protein
MIISKEPSFNEDDGLLPPAEYLSKLKPFSFLTESEMLELLNSMDVVLYKKGKTVFKSRKEIEKLYFIREGKVGLFCGPDLVDTVEKDEIIEIGAALSTTTADYNAVAMEDSIIFEFDLTKIVKLLQKNTLFKEYIDKLNSGSFLSVLKLIDKSESSIYEKRVGLIVNKNPVFCFKGQTLREAINLMNGNDVGSIIIVDLEMRPIGIITHSDILCSIVKGLTLSDSVERVMSHPVITVNFGDSILDAYFSFLAHGINHLAVVEGEKLVGVISVKDLIYDLEAHSHFVKFSKEIIRSKDLEEVKKLSLQINSLIKSSSLHGLSYMSISRLVTTIVDTVLRKALSRFEPSSGITVVLVGEYGRREFDFPLTIDLLILGNKENELTNYAESLSNIGIKIGKVEYCFGETPQFLDSLSPAELLEILDARYIFGNRILYIKFKNALKELTKQGKFLINFKSIFEETTTEYGRVVPLISNGVKVMDHIYGDAISRPTWERLKILESRNVISKELAKNLSEAYIAIRTLELRAKISSKNELVDRIFYKKILKIVKEYKLWVKNMLD